MNNPCLTYLLYTQTHTMQTFMSISSRLDVKLFQDLVVLSDKKKKLYNSISIANLPFMTLCHLLPKIYLLNNLYGDKVLFILYYLFFFFFLI